MSTYTQVQTEEKIHDTVTEIINTHVENRRSGAVLVEGLITEAVTQARNIEKLLKENESFIKNDDLKVGYELIRQYTILTNEVIRMCTEDSINLRVIVDNKDYDDLVEWFDQIDRIEITKAMAMRCLDLEKEMKEYRVHLEKEYGSLSTKSKLTEIFGVGGIIIGAIGLIILLCTGVGAIGVAVGSGVASVGSSFASAAAVGGIVTAIGAVGVGVAVFFR